jgi:pimeloyl-[acyl-carrier protein] methyl ester esterase
MTVHIETTGRGSPLVMLHGVAMHSGLWQPLLPWLAERHRVLLVDLPGHGHSAAVAPYTLDTLTSAVAEAVAASLPKGSAPPLVLGWSLGGAIALNWALMAPERVAGLILTATSPCFVARHDWPHAMQADALQRFGDELAVSYRFTLMRFLTLNVQGSDNARAALAPLRRHLFARGEPSPTVLKAALQLLAAIDLRDRLASIHTPAIVIAGERDALAPAAAGRWLAGALPDARFELVAGAGHAPFLSHPEAFTKAFAGFSGGS